MSGRSVWKMRYGDLSVLRPCDLDAQVREAVDAGFAEQARVALSRLMEPGLVVSKQEIRRWRRWGRVDSPEKARAAALELADPTPDEVYSSWWSLDDVQDPTLLDYGMVDPVLYEAMAVARARLEMAVDGPSAYEAQYWLDEARRLAAERGAVLDEVFDIRALCAQVEGPPQVVDGRFAPDPTVGFDRERWVVCRCGRPGVERRPYRWRRVSTAVFTCLGCGLRDCRHRPLLLTVEVSTLGTLRASNRRHLDQLRCYVTARVRDERARQVGDYGCRLCGPSSWYVTLPGWVRAAKNRGRVLKGIARLTTIADESGLG